MTSLYPVYLMDASAFIHRSFHALGNLKTKTGQPTGAIYGFAGALLKLLKDKQPQALAVVFDSRGPGRRQELFPAYKANRPPMAPDLIKQQELIRQMVAVLGLYQLEEDGYEADDLIAALARKARALGHEVVIVSGDKDFYQLLGPGLTMYDPGARKETIATAEDFKARYDLEPAAFLEMQGLMGDAGDNIPGVPGVGEKTALSLISRFGALENLYQRLGEIKQAKLRDKLAAHRETAFLSRRLAALGHGADPELEPARLKPAAPDWAALTSLFQSLEFSRLLTALRPPAYAGGDLLDLADEARAAETGGAGGPGRAQLSAVDFSGYVLVDNPQAWSTLEAELKMALERALKETQPEKRPFLSLDLETTSLDPMLAEVVGLSLCARPGRSFYIPVAHAGPGARNQDWNRLADLIQPGLAEPGLPKIAQNAKYDWLILRRQGLTVTPPAADPMLASYVLDPGGTRHGLDYLSQRYLNHKPISYQEVTSGKKKCFSRLSPEEAFHYAAEDADLALRLAQRLDRELAGDQELNLLYRWLELPLEDLLTEIERTGVLVSAPMLEALSLEFSRLLAASEAKIYEMAGHAFNLASPRQLAQVLFSELGLPPRKKTIKGGHHSTDAQVLEELALIHPLPAELIAWRGLAKLKSTYTEALPRRINPQTGRVHTSYNQTITATGRLSSSDPNLQNIPIRSEEGRRIRRAFVAPPGHKLISADYSQIELRIMAHYSGDESLLKAFAAGEDIHAQTAAEVFGLPLKEVTPERRRQAKTINFGLIYGQGPFALAKQLGIDQAQAKEFIKRYFKRFKGVKTYIEATSRAALEDGQVSTWFGRKRLIEAGGGYNARQAAVRMAVNTPIQGTAADLIKMAMLAVDRRLKKEALKGRLIMQVHDELVLEAPEREVDRVSRLLKEEMENVGLAPPLPGARPLTVGLLVDVGHGNSWDEAH